MIHSGEAYNLLVFSYALIWYLAILWDYAVFLRDKGGELTFYIDYGSFVISS